MLYRHKCQKKHDGSRDKNPMPPAIAYLRRRRKMSCQNRTHSQSGQQPANVSRVIDSDPCQNPKEQIVAGENEQTFQRALNRLLGNRQMAKIKSGNQRSSQSENCSRSAYSNRPRMQ